MWMGGERGGVTCVCLAEVELSCSCAFSQNLCLHKAKGFTCFCQNCRCQNTHGTGRRNCSLCLKIAGELGGPESLHMQEPYRNARNIKGLTVTHFYSVSTYMPLTHRGREGGSTKRPECHPFLQCEYIYAANSQGTGGRIHKEA